jgi:hypothetical protein
VRVLLANDYRMREWQPVWNRCDPDFAIVIIIQAGNNIQQCVLPQPDGPTRQTNSLDFSDSLRSAMA